MTRKPIVTLTTGLPASGKTTRALELVQRGARRVNLDSLRLMLDNNPGGKRMSAGYEDGVLAVQDAAVLTLVQAGYDVVVDNTHLVSRIPRRLRKLLHGQVVFDVIDCTDVPADVCVERDAGREQPVGEQVIRSMAKVDKRGWRLTAEWMNDAPDMPAYTPKPYSRTDLPPAVICDIDGTVALNDGHRGHYEYDKVSHDKPNVPVAKLVRFLGAHYPIVFMSGRQDSCREATEWWLRHHVPVNVGWELHMRATGDHRPDYIVKAELFDAYVRGTYSVELVLDDRDQVVRLWRQMGLTCLQVADGDF